MKEGAKVWQAKEELIEKSQVRTNFSFICFRDDTVAFFQHRDRIKHEWIILRDTALHRA